MELFILIIPLFIAFAIFSSIAAHKRAQQRKATLAAWATSRGLSFQPDKVYGFDNEHPGLSCLQYGRNRYAYNIVSGRRGDQFMIAFDYHYETESRDSDGDTTTTHHYFSAVLLQPMHPLKPLLIRREGFFDKIKDGFGFNDIDFESAEFSKRYYVTAPDKRWAYDVLNTRSMQLILDQPKHYTIEFDHEVVCIADDDEMEAFGFEHAYKFGAALLDGIPDFAKRA